MSKLASRGLSIAFVSHRLNEVLELCSDIYVLKDGEAVAQTTAETACEAALREMVVGRVRQGDFHEEQRQGRGPKDRVVLSIRRGRLHGHPCRASSADTSAPRGDCPVVERGAAPRTHEGRW